MRDSQLSFVEAAALLMLGACAAAPRAGQEASQQQMLALLMPTRIEIVAPFTRVRSFDDDANPDGIELLLQAVNSLDDPGMLVGRVHVDLLEYIPASGDNLGRRLDVWKIDLSTLQKQREHWNKATQMYEFLLEVNPQVLPPADRFVLRVTYTAPNGEHLTDECTIDGRAARSAWRGTRQSRREQLPAGR
ncbi:MAG: hypothetical protein ACE5HE_08700 [Phycisphaerae bacterium]